MKKMNGKLKNIIITTCVCTAALGSGIGLGVYFGNSFFGNHIGTRKKEDWKQYEMNAQPLLKEYEKIADSNKDLTKVFEGYELVNIAILKYENSENHFSYAHGVATAKTGPITVPQYVNTINIKKGNDFFSESLSESDAYQCAYRFYQSGKKDVITEIEGKLLKGNKALKADWKSPLENQYKTDEFKERWGKEVKESNIYSISEATVKETLPIVVSDEGYEITMKLDVTKANCRYIRQMVSMSKLNDDPIFKELELTYYLNKDLNINARHVHEVYIVKKGSINATTTTDMDEEFYYYDGPEIPGTNKSFNYEEVKKDVLQK